MTEEIFPIVTDEGSRGARLDVIGRPDGCPGLGGWKRGDHPDQYWTRVKGQDAARILELASRAPEHIITLQIDGDRIIGMMI